MASDTKERGSRRWVVVRVCLALTVLGLIPGLLDPRGRSVTAAKAAGELPGELRIVSAADLSRPAPLAPGSLATAFGSRLATQTASADPEAPPTSLAGTSVRVRGVLALVTYVSPDQVNFQIPPGLPAGEASITITAGDGSVSQGGTRLTPVSPALFAADFQNKVPLGTALRFRDGVEAASQPLSTENFQIYSPKIIFQPIDLGLEGDQTFLELYGTGIRGRARLEDVGALIGGISAPVEFAKEQGELVGVDLVRVKLPDSLLGSKRVDLAIYIKTDSPDGLIFSNTISIDLGSRQSHHHPSLVFDWVQDALAGGELTLYGSGFSPEPKGNQVRIAGREAIVESSTPTQLKVRIPYGAQTGFVTVQTSEGESPRTFGVTMQTSLSGLVMDTENRPISGLRVELAGTNIQPVTTGPNGLFIFTDLAEGEYRLKFNSEASALPYPTIITPKIQVLYDADTHYEKIVLQENGKASYQVFGATSFPLTSDRATRPPIRLEEEGVVFEFPSDVAIRFPAGEASGKLTLSRIHQGQTPALLPPERFSEAVAQITPIGAALNPGGRLIFPNLDGYPAGTNVELFRLEQDLSSPHLGKFVRVGVAAVSPDGQRIETAQGAIREAGIYLVSNARPTTTVIGRVVTRGDNLPVPNVQVRIHGQLTQTDDNGSFLLRTVHPGENGRLHIEALQLRADGSIARTEQQAVSRGAGEITSLPEPLIFQSPNRTPSLAVTKFFTTSVGEPLTFRIVATDVDLHQALTITATSPRAGLPAGASLTQVGNIGQFTWTPTASQAGGNPVTLTVTDNGTPVKSSSIDVVVWVRPTTPLAPVPTPMDFMTATVSNTGAVTTFAGKPVPRYVEDLGGGVKLEMVVVPGGAFSMGSREGEVRTWYSEGPQREVQVPEFAIGKYEVTQAQWRAVMGTSPSLVKGDQLPVGEVSWEDIQEFCRRLNAGLGLSERAGYRLPSEAEWEYAARAGSRTPFAFGEAINTRIANFSLLDFFETEPLEFTRWRSVEVGSLGVANAWGLYDMHGNVAEFCQDDWKERYLGSPVDGSPWITPSRTAHRTIRGGSTFSSAFECRSAARGWGAWNIQYWHVGFRLVRTLPRPASF
jgi:uncharacterized protein (TIGR03437 family)